MPNNSLSIIIVNYKSERLLPKCVASIFKNVPDSIKNEIIIVNNDTANLNPLKEKFQNIRIIDHKKNIGFGAASNLGANSASGEFLLFLNPDSEIHSGSVAEILEYFKKNTQVAILGCKILSGGGGSQKWNAGYESGLWNLIRNNIGISRDKKIWQSKKPAIVDWVSGTALFARKNVFEKISGFDEKFFMYFEDMDICKRARNLGNEIWYYPYFSVKHQGGGSYCDKNLQKKDYYRSQEYYYKKHRGWFEYAAINLIRKIFVR